MGSRKATIVGRPYVEGAQVRDGGIEREREREVDREREMENEMEKGKERERKI